MHLLKAETTPIRHLPMATIMRRKAKTMLSMGTHPCSHRRKVVLRIKALEAIIRNHRITKRNGLLIIILNLHLDTVVNQTQILRPLHGSSVLLREYADMRRIRIMMPPG